LVFYAQSTGAVVSGQLRERERERESVTDTSDEYKPMAPFSGGRRDSQKPKDSYM